MLQHLPLGFKRLTK